MSKKQDYNVLRWVILLPTVAVVWLGLFMLILTGVIYLPDDNAKIWNGYIVISTTIIALIEFAITQRIAPKYKKIFAYIAAALVAMTSLYAWWGLAHLAY